MKDNNDKIIYIGKAKDLNNRIKSYYSRDHINVKDKTSILISKIKKIDYIITDNEIEAFLLESNLIKRYRPVFNIELKDQQRYTYLRVTEEKFPKLIVTRRNRSGEFIGAQGEIFGPFVKGSSRFLTVGLLRKMFKVRICNRLPKKECLEYHLGNCDAPCINKTTEQEYNKNIEKLKSILKTNHDLMDFYSKLEVEMKEAASKKEFEKAIQLRDTLTRLNNLQYNQKIENTLQVNSYEEYIGIIHNYIKNIAIVMTLVSKNGVINDMKKYQFDLVADNSLENFISQYYYSNATIPNVVYINEVILHKSKLEKVLKKISGHNVRIMHICAKKSRIKNQIRKIKKEPIKPIYEIQYKHDKVKIDKVKIMNLILNNLNTYIQKNYEPALEDIKRLLNLNKIPHIMDCFDISNFGNDFAVGACTRFVDGMPYKKGYRKFKIKKILNQDDFSMMEEIILRRYKMSEKEEIEKLPNFSYNLKNTENIGDKLPNLIVIDGGRGHLNIALKALKKIKLDKLECVSLAKEHEEIYTPFLEHPIHIPRNNKSLQILQYIRDEAHRFGLTYNRKLRKMTK